MEQRRANEGTSAGTSLVELLIVLAIMGLVAELMCDTLINMARRAALRSAAVNLERVMQRIQFDSYGNSRMRGLRFFKTASGWQYAVYEDGDADGVLNADIAAGIDALMEGPYPLTDRL